MERRSTLCNIVWRDLVIHIGGFSELYRPWQSKVREQLNYPVSRVNPIRNSLSLNSSPSNRMNWTPFSVLWSLASVRNQLPLST